MTKKTNTWVVLILLIPWLIYFGSAFWSSQSFAFRDTGRYFYPAFAWAADEWHAGRVPLWNDRENLGSPFHADPTTSLFYPGKLIFAFPIDYSLAFRIYVAGHVLLAATASYSTLRAWRVSPAGAAVGAMAYSYGGPVLFNYCNVVFLVSAAWFPWTMLAAQRMLRTGAGYWIVTWGSCLGLMIVGGDPQTAYHSILITGGLALLRVLRAAPPSSVRHRLKRSGRQLASDFRCLILGLAVMTGLAAIQILPAYEWHRSGTRAVYHEPRNVYELLVSDRTEEESVLAIASTGKSPRPATWWSLVNSPAGDSHESAIYEFSVGPWRLLEYIWPNVSGRMFPLNHRWTRAIPAEGRIWTPSLYAGIVPLILALLRARWRKGRLHIRWLTWITTLGTVASFGGYGVGWLLQETTFWIHGRYPAGGIGGPTGGLYWCLVTLLPGYVAFRYPAKWLVISAWGLSGLAAHGWDAAWRLRIRAVPRALAGFGIISCLGLVLLAAGYPAWKAWVQIAPSDEIFGPVQIAGAVQDIFGAFLQTAIVCGTSWSIWHHLPDRWARCCAVLLIAGDLAFVHTWFILTAPDSSFSAPIPADVSEVTADSSLLRYYRPYGAATYPSEWAKAGSIQRASECIEWERRTRLPRWPLLDSRQPAWAHVDVAGSDENADYLSLFRVARRHSNAPGNTPHSGVLAVLGTRLIMDGEGNDGESLHESPRGRDNPTDGQLALHEITGTFPRAWIVHQLLQIRPLRLRTWNQLDQRTEAIFFPGGRLRDFRREAVVEAEPEVHAVVEPVPRESKEHCRIGSTSTSQSLEIDVRLITPGLVVVNDLYAPGWQAYARREGDSSLIPVPVVRTNRVMRGVPLGAGHYTLILKYQPTSFLWGTFLSSSTLIGICLVAAWHRYRARRF